jgi:beta-galactosidase
MTTMPGFPRQTRLLNGWWDFQPVPHPDLTVPLEPTEVPTAGWQFSTYLVPGFFTDNLYNESWRASRSGWARTRFTLDELPTDRRLYLTIGAAIPQAHIFVNGQRVAIQEDMFIGEPVEITPYVQAGLNELAVFLTEFRTFPHPQTGTISLIDVPWGCCIASAQAGIWQDVTLEWRPMVQIEDVTIRTSVRQGTLTTITRVRNTGTTVYVGSLRHTVLAREVLLFFLPPIPVTLAPGEAAEFSQTVTWKDYRPWCPEDPYLYHLQSDLEHGNGIADSVRTRFGFREVWIEGHRVLLNGQPQRWSGEWCHKSHSHWLRPEYVRQWYQQIKDLNMNYVRMHTFPHPGYFLDIADEMGILVCQESALHGSGQSGIDTPQLWERAREHVRRMVWRDKNHPSLVLWSVENEMRWSLNIVPSAKEELPKLRALFNRLDPTRPAYHDGDSSLWNEDEQQLISRHYGPSCHGWGWWDKKVPLHAGEMGRWHYASPYVAMQWAGDEVFTDYALLSRSLALDATRIVELARANEVTCTFLWNTSGLDNFRPAQEKFFAWEEPNTPYAKPLQHVPYESEYAWWEKGSGYRPGHSFPLIRHALRPLAVVIREERNQFYTDRSVPHTVYVVNDRSLVAAGRLQVRLEQEQEVLWEHEAELSVPSGGTETVRLQVPLAGAKAGPATLVTRFECSWGTDVVRRELRLADPSVRREPLALPTVGVWGRGEILAWLEGHGVSAVQLAEDAPLDPQETPLLVVAEHSVQPGSDQNRRLAAFLAAGGRALVLEQDHSLFPGLSVARMPVEFAQVRDPQHPVVAGITRDDLRFFGDDPFGLPSSDSWVTLYPYVKPTEEHVVRPIIDSSGGDFGTGGLTWAPVVEVRSGAGVVIASQLRLMDRLAELPVADRLLRNALAYLAEARPLPETALNLPAEFAGRVRQAAPQAPVVELAAAERPTAPIAAFAGDALPGQAAATLAEYAAAGGTILVWGLKEEARAFWQEVIGREIDLWTPEHAVYHLIAPRPSPLLAGLSNEDTCWLDNWTYRRIHTKNAIVEHLLTIPEAVEHLQNAARSGLDVLYGDEQATEWKRMPALSRFFDGPAPRVGGGLVEVPLGQGRVIFCQILWRPDLWQFRRFLGLFLWNLGLPMATDVLAGESTPTAGRASDGYPLTMRVARGLDEAALQELLALSKRRVEYCSDNMTFGQWHGWQVVETPQGVLAASQAPGQGPVVVGLQVRSPEPRKFMETVGGLPNPDLQTFLRLRGAGSVRAWVNGASWGAAELTPESTAYIADIDFEAGVNLVVLVWEPAAPEATLELRFENKDRRPEITFAFV